MIMLIYVSLVMSVCVFLQKSLCWCFLGVNAQPLEICTIITNLCSNFTGLWYHNNKYETLQVHISSDDPDPFFKDTEE